MRGACHYYIIVLVIASRYKGYIDLAAVANAICDMMHSAPYTSPRNALLGFENPLCCLSLHLQGKTKFVAWLVELGAIQVGGEGHFDAIPKLLFVRKANL